MNNISLIITYCEKDISLLPRAIASAAWQLEPVDQLVLVHDAPQFAESVQRLTAQVICPVHYCCSMERGVSAARNTGLSIASCAWVKFLDVDDLLVPFALDAIRAAEPIPALIGGQITVHNGKLARVVQPKLIQILQWMHRANPALVSASSMSREALLAVGAHSLRGDWDLWFRLHRQFGDAGFAVIQDPVCFYTINDALRAEKEKTRSHTVNGMDVREYFRRAYNANPIA